MKKEYNTFTMSAANQNFSAIAQDVEKNGTAVIEKRGNARFYVLTAEEYLKLAGDIFWVDDGDDVVRKFKVIKGIVYSYEVIPVGDQKYKYTRLRVPEGVISIKRTGDEIELSYDDDLMDAVKGRDAVLMYRSSEVDISKISATRAAEAKNRDALCEIYEVRDLLAEYEDAKENSPELIHKVKRPVNVTWK